MLEGSRRARLNHRRIKDKTCRCIVKFIKGLMNLERESNTTVLGAEFLPILALLR